MPKLTIRSPAQDGFHRVEVHRVQDATQARLISQAVCEIPGAETCLEEDFRLLNMAEHMARHRQRMWKARRIVARWKAKAQQSTKSRAKVVSFRKR